MKTHAFSEKESLELITQMLQQTRQNLEIGSGNLFLYYGYAAVVLSVAVFAAVLLTHQSIWAAGWFLMFVVWIGQLVAGRRRREAVVTFMDRAIAQTWQVVGMLFALTVVVIAAIGWGTGIYDFALMLPLSLLYAGIGTAVTGVIVRVGALVYMPLVAFVLAIYMLVMLAAGASPEAWWHLGFGGAFLVMMVVPGHVLNHKAKRSCSRN